MHNISHKICLFLIALLVGMCIGYSLKKPVTEYVYVKSATSVTETDLINAMINLESEGDHKAVSKKGARGLMQIHPIWKKTLIKEGIINHWNEIFIPEKNIKAGKYILTHYLHENKGNIKKALIKYSGGDAKYPDRILNKLKISN